MSGEPRDYDRVYRRPLIGPRQIRIGYTTDRGRVQRFFVQLEYNIDDEWHEVVRYDQDPGAPEEIAHDATEEGLHMDIYRDGEKVDQKIISPPLPADDAFNRAEEHLTENLQGTIERFEKWHGINNM